MTRMTLAKALNAAGYVALVFDYRGFGDSEGPRHRLIPQEQVDDARKALEDLGFKVEVNKILGGFFGTVRAQDPAGKEAPEGSVVTLTVV